MLYGDRHTETGWQSQLAATKAYKKHHLCVHSNATNTCFPFVLLSMLRAIYS